MRFVVASVVSVILVGLAVVHIYWAIGGTALKDGAIPSLDGKPVIRPSAIGTAAVATALFATAVLIIATAHVIASPIPSTWLRVITGLVATVFAARAIGDFRYVGFFKRVRQSLFAMRDTYIYSPLCLWLAILIGIVAID